MSVFIKTSVEDKKYDYNNNEKTSDTTSNSSENSDLSNLVRLSLNKPKEWNWELSTSKSSPHIAFPVIQLYDSATGNLLVEADEDDSVYQGNEKLEKQVIKGVEVPVTRPRSRTIHESLRERKKLEVPITRSQSGSSKRSLIESIEDQVKSFVEQLSDQGIKCNVRSRSVSKARSIIQEETIQEHPKHEETPPKLLRVPNALNKSKSATEILSCKQRKTYSRSSSSVRFTTSFLQRVSECRDDSSSSSDSELDARQKRYFYRSSKAGTLLLCDESFTNKDKKRNRRSRNLDNATLCEIKDDSATQMNLKNEKIEKEDDKKLVSKRVRRKSSSKLKFASINDDKNCIMPEEIEKELNLNCITGNPIMKKANNNDESLKTMTQKELNNAGDYLIQTGDNTQRLIHKSILSKSNNDLRDKASPLSHHRMMRYSCGDFLMDENLDNSDSNTYKRLNRRCRRAKQHRSTSVGNNATNSSRAFNSGGIKNSAGSGSTSTDDDDIDKFVEKTGTKAQQLRLQRPERGKKRFKQNMYRDKPNTDEKIDENQHTLKLLDAKVVEGKRTDSYPLDIDALNSDDVIFHLVQQLTSLNKQQQLPVGYPKGDKISEYQLQLYEKRQRHSPCSIDTKILTNNNTDTSLEHDNNDKVDDEFSHSNLKGLNLIELNNNIPQTLNNNLCENYEGSSSNCSSDEDDKRTVVAVVTTDSSNKNKRKNNIMGSNVSRYSEKGLSGRRAHSSGNLFAGNNASNNGNNTTNTPSKKGHNKKFKKNKSNQATFIPDDISDVASISTFTGVTGGGAYDNASFADPCIVNDISLQQLYSPYNSCRSKNNVSTQQKQAYHGSLPNNLDDADDDVVDGVLNQQRAFLNNMVDGSRYVLNIDSPMIEQNTDAYLIQYNANAAHPQTSISQHQKQHNLQYQIQNSPYNNSVSDKGSSISSNNLGCGTIGNSTTFKSSQDGEHSHPMLHLPLNRNNDAGYDPGYGSERSPEDEVPPLLPIMNHQYISDMFQNLSVSENMTTLPTYLDYSQLTHYDFITKDSIFSVHIVKGPRGLGLSVSGGTDSTAPFPGLIRIKRLFPHQAAWSIGVLKQGDIILAVNGVQLTGLTNYEALEVLRTTPDEVFMIICRPSDERYRKLSPPAEPPRPPLRTHNTSLDHFNTNYCGEFEIVLTKQQGSLGFTLRKEDEPILGHCVRALVREPALSDGRIKPGDKILAVNDIQISNMTHEQAVIFLRQAPDTVKLRLYRDDTLTPLSAVSPTEVERKALNMSSNSKKVVLRPEAINLLTDIAYRKQNSGGDDSTSSSVKSSSASPRRLKRAHKSPHSSTSGSQGSSSNTFMQQSGTESDTSTVVSHDTTSCRVQQVSSHSSISYCNNGLISEPENETEEFYNEDELLSMVDDESYYGERPGRPSYLDLSSQAGHTPVSLLKPQFSIAKANAYELNNLDNEVLDAPTIYTLSSAGSTDLNDDFTSLPCETFLVECKDKNDLEKCGKFVSKFTRGHPLYQSQTSSSNENGTSSLLKWKGVMLENKNDATSSSLDESSETVKTPSGESCCDITVISNSNQHLSRSSSIDNQSCFNSEGNQLITVELNRGWNSRLGFSVTKSNIDGHIYISAVYADSVAARDGRLRKNDKILTVNDESVEGKEKVEVIDLLRTIRGAIVITVSRKNNDNQTEVMYDVGCETEGEN